MSELYSPIFKNRACYKKYLKDSCSSKLAMLHAVDPATETPGDKFSYVEAFLRCQSSSTGTTFRHRSGIGQYIRVKPSKWGINLLMLAYSSMAILMSALVKE